LKRRKETARRIWGSEAAMSRGDGAGPRKHMKKTSAEERPVGRGVDDAQGG